MLRLHELLTWQSSLLPYPIYCLVSKRMSLAKVAPAATKYLHSLPFPHEYMFKASPTLLQHPLLLKDEQTFLIFFALLISLLLR